MTSTIVHDMLSSFTDMMQNPISFFIFVLLGALLIALLFATFSKKWRELLIRLKLLEEDEAPMSFFVWIVGIIVIVKLVQIFLIQPFIVDGNSMLPTYHNKEFLLVDKLSYRNHAPNRGEIIIFRLHENKKNPYEGKYLIKRLIGLPNERVVIRNGVTTIFNDKYPKGLQLDEEYVIYSNREKTADITLGDDEYFVMGDNRDQSYDSRDWGELKREDIKGKVLFRIYPFQMMSYHPGQYSFNE
jgi:signal peptidase I